MFEGERALAADNFKLGEFRLGGIDPAPRGTPHIDITFEFDANYVLHVTAAYPAARIPGCAPPAAEAAAAFAMPAGGQRLGPGHVEAVVREGEARAAEDGAHRTRLAVRAALQELAAAVCVGGEGGRALEPLDSARPIRLPM